VPAIRGAYEIKKYFAGVDDKGDLPWKRSRGAALLLNRDMLRHNA
jgi:hypothetical protein